MAFKDHPLIGFGPSTRTNGYIHAGACGSGLDEAWPMDCPRHSPERSRWPEPFRRREDLSQALVFYRGDSVLVRFDAVTSISITVRFKTRTATAGFRCGLKLNTFAPQCRQILGDEFDPRASAIFRLHADDRLPLALLVGDYHARRRSGIRIAATCVPAQSNGLKTLSRPGLRRTRRCNAVTRRLSVRCAILWLMS